MARRAEELECWQLADRLRAAVIELCALPKVARYCKFCDGFMDAAGSVCRNIQEGFDRNRSTYIVQFFEYSLGSLKEVIDYLHESKLRKFINSTRYDELKELAEHARAKTIKFKRYHERKVALERAGSSPKTPKTANTSPPASADDEVAP
jgi:four helix bundle protein